ncbi:MAG TPA: methyltransferase domain-containing protein, partial [Thermodesulfobacteriota bacterium]|nr:methyltransferase domain-containing protein [Thermodesulfobacteriota bacterium]
LGNAFRRLGKSDEAIASYREAVRLKTDHQGAWRGLARVLMQTGGREEAVGAFDQWLRTDPGNPVALYLRAVCKGEGAPDRAPDDYIHHLFDGGAEGFDAHLERLEYNGPALLGDALSAALGPAASLDVLDAGCGTGLCGASLKRYARRLVGVDLSPGMLVKANARNVYDDLIGSELTEFMKGRKEAFDVIASSDTLCYFGALEEVFRAVAGALRPAGFFAFTLEDSGAEAPGWKLNSTGRYIHSRSYVESGLKGAGLAVKNMSSVVLRKEGGKPVAGHLVVARKPPET